MPSKDPINRKANEWMEREGVLPSGSERQSETAPRARGRAGSRTARREMSAQVQRLAKSLGQSPDELAARIPADTLRRTKYPVIETLDENGRKVFKHDIGITDDALIASNRR